MVPVRTLFMAALLGAAAVSAHAGDGRRLWTDPPPGVGPSVEPASAAPEAWPDEAQRRLLPDQGASAPVEAAAFVETAPSTETAARAEPTGSGPAPRETAGSHRDGGPEAQPVPARAPAVSDRTKRRLGVLAGFAGAAAPPEAVSGRRAQQAQRALGRVRILQIRRGRVVLVYTRS